MSAGCGGILCLIRLILQECCLLMWGIGKGTLIEASDTVIRQKTYIIVCTTLLASLENQTCIYTHAYTENTGWVTRLSISYICTEVTEREVGMKRSCMYYNGPSTAERTYLQIQRAILL